MSKSAILTTGAALAIGLLATPVAAMTERPSEPGDTSSAGGGATSVPEPGALGLFGFGLAAVVIARRRKRKR